MVFIAYGRTVFSPIVRLALQEFEVRDVGRGDGLDELEAVEITHSLEEPFTAAE